MNATKGSFAAIAAGNSNVPLVENLPLRAIKEFRNSLRLKPELCERNRKGVKQRRNLQTRCAANETHTSLDRSDPQARGERGYERRGIFEIPLQISNGRRKFNTLESL